MFKNLKVGTKILIGFGTVLALMVILAVVVLITNVSSIKNIENSSHVSDVQTIGNTLLDTYNDARIGANIIYVVIKDEEYDRIVKDYDTVQGYISDMRKMASEEKVLNQFSGDINTMSDSIDSWYKDVCDIQRCNVEMAAQKGEMKSYGVSLVDGAKNAYDIVTKKLEQDIAANADAATLTKDIALISDVKNLIEGVYESRRNAAVMTETYDTASADSFLQTISSTKAAYEDLISKLTGDNKTTVEGYYKDYVAYSEVINNFINTCNESNTYITTAKAQGVKTTEIVLALSAEFDKTMAENFDRTSSSASVALLIIIVLAIVAIIIGLVLAMIIMRSITGPLAKMYKTTNIVATTGRMTFTAEETEETKSAISGDEIGQTVLSFVNMMDRLVVIADDLEKVSQGDLTVDIAPIGAEDTMGNALKNTIDNLNDMFSGINSASEQVSSGSKQIADGAQTLATGSTEQASSVEELSSAIFEIAQATKENATKANKAATLSEAIKSNAQKGEEEMNNMMAAVKEINESSQNISKVIKVIDDIAFQTNILALNAAVEAARAGEAGKGFAVVADEVRNLASKSAEAAKNTGSMISSSIEKAELGTRIANETAASLNLIVSGILESTEIINDIAVSSEDQSMKIDQINVGISQVSEVVQQNSATAEESAAASEEMNGQTIVLADLVAQFKLK